MAISARTMVTTLFEGGVSELQIAEGTGISQATINRIRTGTHADPRVSTYHAISEFYLRKQAEAARPPAPSEGDHAAP